MKKPTRSICALGAFLIAGCLEFSSDTPKQANSTQAPTMLAPETSDTLQTDPGVKEKKETGLPENEVHQWEASVPEERLKFTPEEAAKLAELKSQQSKADLEEFEKLLSDWTATFSDPKIAIHSNPEFYRKSPEYEKFAEFCKARGKGVWPQLFEQLEKGHPIVNSAIVDLLAPGREDILEELHVWLQNQYRDGKFITPQNAQMRFAKKLIAAEL